MRRRRLLQRACGGEDPIGLATITAALDDVRRAVRTSYDLPGLVTRSPACFPSVLPPPR
jgi:hypothetical protein